MQPLIFAILVFLFTHLIPGIKPIRAFLIRHLGKRLYMGLFSAASIVVMVWLGWAYKQAPYLEVWPYAPDMRWIALLAMPIACLLIVAGLSMPNPFSLGLGGKNFDCGRPGIVAICKHPALWGLLIWALAHVAVNGDWASLLMFGLMGFLAALGPLVFDRRRKASMGETEWAQAVSDIQKTPLIKAFTQIGWPRYLAAAVLYGLLLYAHEPILGVSPLGS